jgi:hypothetical protein
MASSMVKAATPLPQAPINLPPAPQLRGWSLPVVNYQGASLLRGAPFTVQHFHLMHTIANPMKPRTSVVRISSAEMEMKMIYGYAKVSALDQNLDGQIAALNAAGCDKVFFEKESGTKERGVKFGRKLKLTAHQRQEALARREAGETTVAIARSFKVSHSMISRL